MAKHIITRMVPVLPGQVTYEVFAISRKTNHLLPRYKGPAELDALHFCEELCAAKSWRLLRVNGVDIDLYGVYS